MSGKRDRRIDVDALRAVFMAPAYQANAEASLGPGDYDFAHFVDSGLDHDISPSFYFDSEYYGRQRPAAPSTPLLIDFLTVGVHGGAHPHPLVDPGFIVRNSDIDHPAEVLAHLASGRARRSRTHPLFWSDYYLESNPDIAGRIAHPLNHYLTAGHRRRREPNPFFNSSMVLERAGIDGSNTAPLLHFLALSMHLDESPSPLFDPAHYRRTHDLGSDVASSAYLHFLEFGLWSELDPHPMFDSSWYRRRYGSAVPDDLPPVLHYLRHEHERQHQPSARFHPGGVERIRVAEPDDHAFGGRILERYLLGGATAAFNRSPVEISTAIRDQVNRLAEIAPLATARLLDATVSTEPIPQNFNTHMTRKTRALQRLDHLDRGNGGLVILDEGLSHDLRSELVRAVSAASLEQGTPTVVITTGTAVTSDPLLADGVGLIDFADTSSRIGLNTDDSAHVLAEWLVGRATRALLDTGTRIGGTLLSEYGLPLGELMRLASLHCGDLTSSGSRILAEKLDLLDILYLPLSEALSTVSEELALTAPDIEKLEVLRLPLDDEGFQAADPGDHVAWYGSLEVDDRIEAVYALADHLPDLRFVVHTEGALEPPLESAGVEVEPVRFAASVRPAWVVSTGRPTPATLSAAAAGIPVVGATLGDFDGSLDEESGYPLRPDFTIEELSAQAHALVADRREAERRAAVLASRLGVDTRRAELLRALGKLLV